MTLAHESPGLQSHDPDETGPYGLSAEEDDPFRPAAGPAISRRFFVIFLAGSLVFHVGLVAFVVLFDPTRQLSAEVVEIPVDLVSEDQAQKSGLKGGSGGPSTEAKAQAGAQRGQAPGGASTPGAEQKPDSGKQAAGAGKPAETPAKPQEAEKPKPQTEQPADPQTRAAEDKAQENKAAEKKPEDNKPSENKPNEDKPAETKAAEAKSAETKPAETKPAEEKPQAPETKPEAVQKDVAQKQQPPAPEPPKPAERKAPSPPKSAPQSRQAAAQPSQQQAQAQPPMQSREEARRALEAAGILPEQEPRNQPAPQPAERPQQPVPPMPKFYQPEDRLSLAIPAPMPTDDADSEAVPYKLIVFGAIERAKDYPISARLRHAAGHVVVAFSVDDNGQPQNIVMLRSSGETDLDEEAVAMISRAGPFPVPPTGAQRDFAVDIGFGGS